MFGVLSSGSRILRVRRGKEGQWLPCWFAQQVSGSHTGQAPSKADSSTPSLLALLQLFTPMFTALRPSSRSSPAGSSLSVASSSPKSSSPAATSATGSLVAVPLLPAMPPGTSTPSHSDSPSSSSRSSRQALPPLGRPMTSPLSTTRADPLRRRHEPRSTHLQPLDRFWSVGGMIGSSSASRRPPSWAPTKVFALPVAARLYHGRRGAHEGKGGPKPRSPRPTPTTTRPETASLIQAAAAWVSQGSHYRHRR